MFQVMVVTKVSSGSNIAVTSQLAQCETRIQADAICAGIERENKGGKPLPGFAVAAIKLYSDLE